MNPVVASLFVVVAGLAHAEPPGGAIHVDVSGMRGAAGVMSCQLFAEGKGFPDKGGVAVTVGPIVTKANEGGGARLSASCSFTGLLPGTYAVAVFHDENRDKQVNKNMFGAPTEGYGVSNNKTYAFAAPKWAESTFVLGDNEKKRLTVALRY